MKWIFSITMLVFVLLTSCSAPVYVQKDDATNLADYKTYTWIDTKANEKDESQKPTAYVDLSVRNAVNAELRKAGWSEVNENPDVLLSYDVLVERNTEQQKEAVYSEPFTRMYYNPYRRQWSRIYYPSQFVGYQVYDTPVREGTITISMIDAKTDKNIWQGWTTERLNNSRITDEEISKSIRNIFGKFDIAAR